MHIQIVNINNLSHTMCLIGDLLKQTAPFKLTVIDQGSTETMTQEYLDSLQRIPFIDIEVIRNNTNIDLNRLWNRLYEQSDDDYLCFLNNDVRVSRNFVSDTINILERENSVGVAVHTTNHPDYRVAANKPKYVVLFGGNFVQGFDFTMRKEAYIPIPDELKVFGGDDWLFTKMYDNGWKTAISLSSPIIHYKAKSRQYHVRDRKEDQEALVKLGIQRLAYKSRYTKDFPTFEQIIEEEDLKERRTWYE